MTTTRACIIAVAVLGSLFAIGTTVFAQSEVIEIPLKAGAVTFEQVEGLTYGVGDVPCGYGLRIRLPAGTVMCFSGDTGHATLDLENSADDALVADILARSPDFRLQPSPQPSGTPASPNASASATVPPSPPRTGSGLRSETDIALWIGAAAAGFAALAGGVWLAYGRRRL